MGACRLLEAWCVGYEKEEGSVGKVASCCASLYLAKVWLVCCERQRGEIRETGGTYGGVNHVFGGVAAVMSPGENEKEIASKEC